MWTGRIPYGKCDIVPGECFVATEFQHIVWLPIIPIRSWVIVEGSIETYDDYVRSFKLKWSGRPIKFSLKSFALAWIRTCLWIVMICAPVYLAWTAILWFAGHWPIAETASGLAVLIVAIVAYRLSYRLTQATPQRAEFLRTLLGQGFGSKEAPNALVRQPGIGSHEPSD